MGAIRWTKYQDFYLRLGFLKVAVAILDAERRSLSTDLLLRRLSRPLLPPPPKVQIGKKVLREPGEGSGYAPIVEALLKEGECPSLLHAITGKTSYKVLDWARNVQLLGRGNQISERGLLLRSYLDKGAVGAFLAGDQGAWNPFPITESERYYLLFHLTEIDGVTQLLIDALAKLDPQEVIETFAASRLFCTAFTEILGETEPHLKLRDIPGYRTARELAITIAEELGLVNDLSGNFPWLRDGRHAPRPPVRKSLEQRTKRRHTTKNADHQTIPRFEQLVDLGMLTKPLPPENDVAAYELARRRWRYVPTKLCRSWAAARARSSQVRFAWEGFGRAVVEARSGAIVEPAPLTPGGLIHAATYLMCAFERVGRRVGMTPFDSVGLRATLDASLQGDIVEMGMLNRMLLAMKRAGVAPETVFFASGNDVDEMFVQLRPGFIEGVRANADEILSGMRPSERQA
jgi:hypothetical protein